MSTPHVFSWGIDTHGQLGRQLSPTLETNRYPRRVALEDALDDGDYPVQIHAGRTFSLVTTAKGRMISWGGCEEAYCDSTGRDSSDPVGAIFGPSGGDERFIDAAAGSDHVIALTAHMPVVERVQPESGRTDGYTIPKHSLFQGSHFNRPDVQVVCK